MNSQPRSSGFSTLATHAGTKSPKGADALPLNASTELGPFGTSAAFMGFDGLDALRTDPTNAMLEERVAALEGGTAALAVASGRTALLLAFHALLQPGDEFVAARRLQHATVRQFMHAFKSFGWRVKWADAERPETFVEALTDRTKAIFIECIAEPGGLVTDIGAIATIARRARVPLIVDNALATPYLVRPLEHGADIIVHSAASLLAGQGDAVGGLIIDGGTFDWMRDDGFPSLSQPQPSYGDAIIGATFGNFAFVVACRALGLRDLGAPLSPIEADALLGGIETLSLRMQRQCDSANATARHLARHPQVRWVRYAGLEDDPGHALIGRYCPRGAGTGFAFGLAGGHDAAAALGAKLKLFSSSTQFGDTRSSLTHPASSTHRHLAADQMAAAGMGPEVLRVSIGLEDSADIIADLDQALASTRI